ncbi:MAG: flagellar hook-associated protein FlgL [Halioglobus sp.]|nr:flagellar hook-associated protein FlgL [Halioglobus sp.]
MRMSSVQIFQQGISAILMQQAEAARTEQQLATGRRILSPSDDPAAATQIMDITEDLERVDQFQRNANAAEGQLALEETVLADAGTLIQRVRELVVQANNATQTPETRRNIAIEIEARIDELVGLANTRDAGGEYIFGGFQSQSQPFFRQGSDVAYAGDDGQRFVQVGNSVQVAVRDSGADVFMRVPSGNGTFSVAPGAGNSGTAVIDATATTGPFASDDYTIGFSQATPADPVTYQVTDSSATAIASGTYSEGQALEFAGARVILKGTPAAGDTFEVRPSRSQDIFGTLRDIADALNTSGTTPAEQADLNNAMTIALGDLDQALGKVLEVRSDVGVRLQHVQSQLDVNESFNLQLQETLSGIRDLDFAEAVTRFNLQLTALEAAQQSFARMQGLSLFNFL